MRPVLARTSSAASGFRFCGMIDEPVVNLSDSRTKPHCGEVQFTISSASRDRCMAAIDAAAKRLEREVAIRDGVERVGRGPLRSRAPCAVMSRSMGKEVPASAAAPSGHSASRLAASAKAAPVAAKHLDIGKEMMAEGDRLRGLEMGEARHHRGGVLEAPFWRAQAEARRARRRWRRSRP